jgi:hypothetical protein
VKSFPYVGPAELKPAEDAPRGDAIMSRRDLVIFIERNLEDLDEPFTFVVREDGTLLLAPRRSEHVRAAGGLPVLAAGEIGFNRAASVTYVSNQSVGYCPDESSWIALADAIRLIGVEVPIGFDDVFVFRTCERCNQVNIVKDDWFECENCGGSLRR